MKTESPADVGYMGTTQNPELDSIDTPFTFVGIPHGVPYFPDDYAGNHDAPKAIRRVSSYAPPEPWTRYDFTWGRELFPNGIPTVTDVGDVESDVRDIEGSKKQITSVIKRILKTGSIPIIQGGPDSVPPLVVAAYEEEPVSILHIDAHLDYRDELYGHRDGYSNPIRRIREMPWVNKIVQIGLRGRGTAGRAEVEAAKEAGNIIFTARQIQEEGVSKILEILDTDDRWFITMDCDGLDPSIAPGVFVREPGGLSFYDAYDVVHHLTTTKRLAGFLTTEYRPALDMADLTAITVCRLQETAIAMHGVNS